MDIDNTENKTFEQHFNISEFIKNNLDIQTSYKKIIHQYINNLTDYINMSNIDNDGEFVDTLNRLQQIIQDTDNNIVLLDELKLKWSELEESYTNKSQTEVVEFYKSVFDVNDSIDKKNINTLELIHFFSTKYAFSDMNIKNQEEQINNEVTVISTDNSLDNNILYISEKDQKVLLPYKYVEIEEILSKRGRKYKSYNSVKEVINDLYVLPLSEFKNPYTSRFRDSFNILKKEISLLESFETAIEIMLKHDLNPAIIRACKNKRQLDGMLGYFNEGKLNEFPAFKIEIEGSLIKVKNFNKISN